MLRLRSAQVIKSRVALCPGRVELVPRSPSGRRGMGRTGFSARGRSARLGGAFGEAWISGGEPVASTEQRLN